MHVPTGHHGERERDDSGNPMSWPRLRRRAAVASSSPPPPPAPSPATRAPSPASPYPDARLVIDALGRKCPIPIIMLAEQIRDVPVGQLVAVLADDPAARTDVPAWCHMK